MNLKIFLPLIVTAFLLTSSTTSQSRNYDDIFAYIDRQVIEAQQARDDYWRRDFSSVENYLVAIEPYRADFAAMLGIPPECRQGIMPELVEQQPVTDMDGIIIEYLVLRVCAGELEQQALVAYPAGQSRGIIVAYHGSWGSPELVLGQAGDDYHHSFGLALAQMGYTVVAPLLVTEPDGISLPYNLWRNQLDKRAYGLGLRLNGIEVGKGISMLDYLETLEQPIGTYGISLGGMMSLYLAAVDQRIKVAVISGYLEDRNEKYTGHQYDYTWWDYESSEFILIPGLLLKFDDADIASLIVPRPLFVEVGQADSRYLPSAALMPEITGYYTALGLEPERAGFYAGEGGHEIFLDDAAIFLDEWLPE